MLDAVVGEIDEETWTANSTSLARRRLVREVIRAYNRVKGATGGARGKRILTPDQARAARLGKKQPPA